MRSTITAPTNSEF